MTRLRTALLSLALLLPLLAVAQAPAAADTVGPTPVPVRVRILRGSRQKPPAVDPKLDDLKPQLGKLSYTKWEQVEDRQLDLSGKKTEFVPLPNGDNVGLTVLEVQGESVTVEVSLAQRNTQSRLTVDKKQRIVHQVTGEKNGVAYFVTVRALK